MQPPCTNYDAHETIFGRLWDYMDALAGDESEMASEIGLVSWPKGKQTYLSQLRDLFTNLGIETVTTSDGWTASITYNPFDHISGIRTTRYKATTSDTENSDFFEYADI